MVLLPPDKVVEKVSTYLKHIFTHLDEISSYFQCLVSLHDGVMDSMDMFTTQSIIFSKCIKPGFQWLSINTVKVLAQLLRAPESVLSIFSGWQLLTNLAIAAVSSIDL